MSLQFQSQHQGFRNEKLNSGAQVKFTPRPQAKSRSRDLFTAKFLQKINFRKCLTSKPMSKLLHF